MPAPAAAAAAAPLIKGLLGAGARGAATGGVRAAAGNAAKGMAADAVKGGAKEGMKNFARNMTGKTSEDYKSRVDGVNPETGEYLTPEERKARFKGFATAPTKPGSQKLLSGGPTQAVAALPPAEGVGNTDTGQEKVVNHLEKIQMYLEKLLVLEENALGRLQDRILNEARSEDRSSAEEEEESMEKGKGEKKSKGNPLMQGVKKKAGGIFKFLMDFAMKFVGYKILEWIGKPENQEKVTKMIEFFQGLVSFVTTVAGVIGAGFEFATDTIEKSIEGITFLAEKISDFFGFKWLDVDALLEPIKPVISFFTETIPNAMNSFADGIESTVSSLEKLPEQFVGIVQKIADGFLGFLGLTPSDTKEDTKVDGDESDPIPSSSGTPLYQSGPPPPEGGNVQDNADKKSDNKQKMARGGMLRGATHAQGGVPIEAEGGEYVLNRRAVAAVGGGVLDDLNFNKYPAVGRGEGSPSMASNGGIVQKFAEGGAVHPTLQKLSDKNIKKAHTDAGYCVKGSLLTMEKSGAGGLGIYTDRDEGNNPRGAMVQLQQNPHNWKSIGGTSKLLKSPYGQVNTGIFSKKQYVDMVDEGKIPSGALVFQTKHGDWNGTNYRSRGYDMAIAQNNGQTLWNGVDVRRKLMYGESTKHIAVLTPDGKMGNGEVGEISDADNGAPPGSKDDDGKNSSGKKGNAKPKTAKEKSRAIQGSLLQAANALSKLMGGEGLDEAGMKGVTDILDADAKEDEVKTDDKIKLDKINFDKPINSEDILNQKQEENNKIKGEINFSDGLDTKIIDYQMPSDNSTSFDVDFEVPTLGDNLPPFSQALYPINL